MTSNAHEQLVELAKLYGVEVHWTDRCYRDFEAHVQTRQVWIGEPTSALAYVAALHEYGHICAEPALRYAQPGTITEELACEAAAWGWALEHGDLAIIDSLAEHDWAEILDMLGSFPRAALDAAKQAGQPAS